MASRNAHGHSHSHDHEHDHEHSHEPAGDLGEGQEHLDLSVPDGELPPNKLARRNFLRGAGLLGATAAAGSVLAQPAAAHSPRGNNKRTRRPNRGYLWLAGDHHIHTQYSPDGLYRVADQVQHAAAYGLDWMVITDHGSAAHAKIGVELVNPDIVAARKAFEGDVLVFQGLEWNIPAAEHATVFVHPGRNEVAVLKEFENSFDGTVNATTASSPENEEKALQGLDFLAASVTSRRVQDALFLANHPARRGIDSPHEVRGWRDRQPTVAIGMEGAPGHQAAGIPTPEGPGAGRGYYDNAPSANSFAGYPPESYVTWGGFDWMTSTVAGLWDSLLAEGRPWMITANSDSHAIYLDTATRGPGSDFNANGRYNDPVYNGGVPARTAGDYWPGYYSRTHVGARSNDYAQVMAGLREGRVWVDHGGLLDSIDIQVRERGSRRPGWTLGGIADVRRGIRLELAITIRTATLPNWAQFIPALAKVDVIRGTVTGPSADRDSFRAPDTKVVQTFDVSGRTGEFTLTHDLGRVDGPCYLRVRGSDGNRTQVGLNGADVDPAGPAVDVIGNADPWTDLWFYTNPVWVVPTGRGR